MRQGVPRIKRTLNENNNAGPKVKNLTAGAGEANLHDDSTISSARAPQQRNVLESLEPESRDLHSPELNRKPSDACSLAESIHESPDQPSRGKSDQRAFDRKISDASSVAESVHDSADQPVRRKSQSEELAESLRSGRGMDVPDHPNSVVKEVSKSALVDVKPFLAHSNDIQEQKLASEAPSVALPTVAKTAASRSNTERSPPDSVRSALPSVGKTAGSKTNMQPSPPTSARPPVSARSAPRGPRGKAQTPREPATSQTPSAPSVVSRDSQPRRAQSERGVRKRDSTIAGGRLAQLVSEVSAHLKSFREPPDANGWLQEEAQLELFLEEMRWLLSEHEKSGVGPLAAGKQDSMGPNDDKEQASARDQLRRLQLEHNYLLQRVQNANPAIQEHTAELKVVEAEIASEKNRQRQIKAESRQRDLGMGRYIIDGEPIDGTTRALQDIDRLNADLGVWKIKNNSLQKQVREAAQIMRNSQAKRDRLVQKAEELEAVLNSAEFTARQAERQKAQERRKAEESGLQQTLAELQEARHRALINHRRNKRDGNKELLQLVERCKALEDREKESAAVRRMLQREWHLQSMHEREPIIDSMLADRMGSMESEFPSESARQHQPASPKAKQTPRTSCEQDPMIDRRLADRKGSMESESSPKAKHTPRAFAASPSNGPGVQETEPMNSARRGSRESECSNRSGCQSQTASPKAKQTATHLQSSHKLELTPDNKLCDRKNSNESGLSNRSTQQSSHKLEPKLDNQLCDRKDSIESALSNRSTRQSQLASPKATQIASAIVESPKSVGSANQPRPSLSRRSSKASNRGSGEHGAHVSPVEDAKPPPSSQDDASRLNKLRDQTGQDLLSALGSGALDVAVTDFLQKDTASNLEARKEVADTDFVQKDVAVRDFLRKDEASNLEARKDVLVADFVQKGVAVTDCFQKEKASNLEAKKDVAVTDFLQKDKASNLEARQYRISLCD